VGVLLEKPNQYFGFSLKNRTVTLDFTIMDLDHHRPSPDPACCRIFASDRVVKGVLPLGKAPKVYGARYIVSPPFPENRGPAEHPAFVNNR